MQNVYGQQPFEGCWPFVIATSFRRRRNL